MLLKICCDIFSISNCKIRTELGYAKISYDTSSCRRISTQRIQGGICTVF